MAGRRAEVRCNCLLATVPGAAAAARGRLFVAKDVFDTQDLVTTYGSSIYRDHVPRRSATAVVRMIEAGYALLGKANLHEFAWGATSENPHFGPVLNPLDQSRIAGGSSGGSAAAVAAGLCDTALGTDTGGSIRIPAACCGVVGFKPSFGAVPLDGVFPLAPSLDHAGPIGVNVSACVSAFAALTQSAYSEASSIALEDVRVGTLESFFDACSPGVVSAARRAAEFFGERVRVDFPAPTAFDNTPLFFAEAAVSHRATFPSRERDYGTDVAARLRAGNAVLARDYIVCCDELDAYRTRCAAAFDVADILLAPTVPCVAPKLGLATVKVAGRVGDVGAVLTRNTRPFNNLGWPVVAMPCGTAEDDLPASVSLIGRAGDDRRLLAIAEQLEAALGTALSDDPVAGRPEGPRSVHTGGRGPGH